MFAPEEVKENPDPCIRHTKSICKMQFEDDEIQIFIKERKMAFRCWQCFILSTTHPYAETFLKSPNAIKHEILSHLRFYPSMIHPMSEFRNYWGWFQAFFTYFIMLAFPILNSFYLDYKKHWFTTVLLVDVIFLADIILCFFTGYFDDYTKTVIMNPKIVSSKYLKGYFALDVISAFPAELFEIFIIGQKNKYTSLLNFLMIIRIRNLLQYTQNIRQTHLISLKVFKIIKVFIILTISLHWAACLQYFIPFAVFTWTENVDPASWVFSDSMKKRNTVLKKYILCLHRATTSIVCSTHFLQVATLDDILLNMLLSLIGKIGFIYLLVEAMHLMAMHCSSREHHSKWMQQLNEYMQYKKLPYEIQRRLRIYCDYVNVRKFDRDKRILNQITRNLREELILHNHVQMLTAVNLLQQLPKSIVVEVAKRIRSQIYLADDIIVQAGTYGDALSFVVSGTVAVYTHFGKEVCHLEEGAHFGEIALVTENSRRIATVVAVETCEICTLSRTDFQKCIAIHPFLLSRLQKMALERMKTTLNLEDAYENRDGSLNTVNISKIKIERASEDSMKDAFRYISI